MRLRYFAALLPLMLAACEPADDTVDLTPHGEQRMNFSVPEVLANGTVDLNNPQAVAKALGIRLNGDKKQHLYDIVMSAPNTERKVVTRTIPIRVDNVTKGSAIIYSAGGARYEPSKVVVKPSVSKAKPKPKKKVTKK